MMNSINQLLDQSDKIKKLSEDAIKDIWVRKELWRRNKRKYMRRLGSEEYKEFMAELKADESGASLYGAVRRCIDLQLQNKINESDKSPEEFLFDYWTDDDLSDKERLALCRQDIDNNISGCCGMPKHEVIRHNINSWLELEKDL